MSSCYDFRVWFKAVLNLFGVNIDWIKCSWNQWHAGKGSRHQSVTETCWLLDLVCGGDPIQYL